jgi:hypothetical protein
MRAKKNQRETLLIPSVILLELFKGRSKNLILDKE